MKQWNIYDRANNAGKAWVSHVLLFSIGNYGTWFISDHHKDQCVGKACPTPYFWIKRKHITNITASVNSTEVKGMNANFKESLWKVLTNINSRMWNGWRWRAGLCSIIRWLNHPPSNGVYDFHEKWSGFTTCMADEWLLKCVPAHIICTKGHFHCNEKYRLFMRPM